MAEEEVTDNEISEEIIDCFNLFDRKGDGKVEDSSICNVLRSCGLNPVTQEVDKIIASSDLKGKRLDFETFYGIYQQMAKAKPLVGYDDMVEGLKTLDRDSTGYISAAELRHVLMNVGDRMTEEQVTEIVSPGEDTNGSIKYAELIKAVMAK